MNSAQQNHLSFEVSPQQTRLPLAEETSALGVWEWNLQSNSIDWSPECAAVLGVERLGTTSDFWRSLLHPDDLPDFLETLEASSDSDPNTLQECRVLSDEGSERYVQFACMKHVAATGEPLRIVGALRDIAERRQANVRFYELEENFRSIIEHSPVSFFIKDLEGRYTVANRQACQSLGQEQSIVGSTDLDHLDPDSARELQEHDQQVIAEDRAIEMENRVAGDGYARTFLAVKFPLHDIHGKPIAICGIATDITARKRAERMLQLNQFCVDHAAIGVIWVRKDGSLHYVNDWVCENLGYSREQLLAMSVMDFTNHTPETWAGNIAHVRQAGSHQLESTHRRRDGSTYPVHVTAHYDQYEGDEYVFAFTQDISKRREAERRFEQQSVELLHASRLSTMGQMVATMSHEVAQPLSAIGNYAAACLRTIENLPPADREHLGELSEYLSTIRSQNLRCGEILQRLRDFSRIGAHQRAESNLGELLQESVNLVAGDLRRQGVQVRLELPEDLPSVCVDRIQIQQIVVNLLTNARDALQHEEADQKIILINADSTEKEVFFVVADYGKGLAEDHQEMLFEPFFTSKHEGMGLGLSICQNIVQNHDGRIEASNNDVGGASFQVWLPLIRSNEV